MHSTPIAEQMRIVISGLRNSGKSSLMNNLFEKEVAIVSDSPGTTTDPVLRTLELGRLGAVTVTDTAGFDDAGGLGELRIKKSFERIDNSDILLFTTRIDTEMNGAERAFLERVDTTDRRLLIALTFADCKPHSSKLKLAERFTAVPVDNIGRLGFNELKAALMHTADSLEREITPCAGLVAEKDLVILVTPIDTAAPKGRLILPQVETLRDLLDRDCAALVVKEHELRYFYANLKIKPRLVITDSQAFKTVAAAIPRDQALTSFSILFARKKGDLQFYIEGIKQLKNTPGNARILILESCSHHRQAEDIGTVKIPGLFRQLVQPGVEFDYSRELPDAESLARYFMVINCAGCMATRRKIMNRLAVLKHNKVYAANYGLFLAWAHGLLPRALEPFPVEHRLYGEERE